MLQNKIYQNFLVEIIRIFSIILFGLSLVALTVRSVNFLDLVVDSGYPLKTYFKYSILNLFGIAPKFIPLSFLLALMVFIIKHIQDSEFVILWSSGVKKIQIVNLFFFSSILALIFYIVFSVFLTPLALNSSRQLLSNDKMNSFLPVVRTNQFSDSFKKFTFFVEKKTTNELKNIFLYDNGNNLKNLSADSSKSGSVVIIAKKGIIDKTNLFLFNGQIITTKKDESDNEIIKFEQFNINLNDLTSTTIKLPKLQETSTFKLFNCFIKNKFNNKICEKKIKEEIIPILSRRTVLPFYIPIIALICSFLLIKSKHRESKKIKIFLSSFLVLIFVELTVRYTGISNILRYFFIITPFILSFFLYFLLIYKFSNESKIS